MKKYYYRREDNGRLVGVDYGTAIRQDSMGRIVTGGTRAKRVYSMDPKDERKERSQPVRAHKDRPIISDTLGVTINQLDEMEADRKLCGFKGVEFVPDPLVDGFYQAKIDSETEKWRYAEHRGGMIDKNSRNGGKFTLTEEDFEKARELVDRGIELRRKW